jgi:hypothetical protein
MRATRNAFPEIRDYWAKKHSILASLMDCDLERHGDLLEALADAYSRATHYDPFGFVLAGPAVRHAVEAMQRVRGRLRRNSAELRKAYVEAAVEIMLEEFPEIAARQVDPRRLREFSLPATPPNPEEICLRAFEQKESEDTPTSDCVTPEMLNETKRLEEEREHHERRTVIAIEKVRERALARGLGSVETIDGVLYEMSVGDFFDLAGDFPMLSRVYFKPRPPST